MSVGVILTRAQPIHLGHVDIIKQALNENETVLLVVGSSNKSFTERNPFDIDFRMTLIRGAIKELHLSKQDEKRLLIMILNDWSTETAYKYAKEWGSFLYYNIVNKIGQKEFNFYYNDDVSIVEKWFNDDIKPRINIINSARVRDVLSTIVRQAILNEDISYLSNVLSKINFKYVKYMKTLLLECDKDDFIMN